MILNNAKNIYIGGTQVGKIMFNFTRIWPQLQNTIAEGMRRLSFFGQQNASSGSSSSEGSSGSGSGSSSSGSSGEGGNSGSSESGGSSSGGGDGNSGSGSGSSGNEGNTPAIEISGSGSFIYTYRIYGNEQIINSVTYGVGDQNNNQYIMPIVLSDNAYNIILSEPLIIRNGIADYIDYRTQKRYNGDGTTESVIMPEFILCDGLNYIEVDTKTIPSKIEIVFNETQLTNSNFTIEEIDNDDSMIYGPGTFKFNVDQAGQIISYKLYGNKMGWLANNSGDSENLLPKLGVGQYWYSAKIIEDNYNDFSTNTNLFSLKTPIPITENTLYYYLVSYTLKQTSGQIIMKFYNANNDYLSTISLSFNNGTTTNNFISPPGATQMRISASINFWQVGLTTSYTNTLGNKYYNISFNNNNYSMSGINKNICLYDKDYIYYYKAPSALVCNYVVNANTTNGILYHNGRDYDRYEMQISYLQNNCVRFNGRLYNEYDGIQIRLGGGWNGGNIIPLGKYKIGVTIFNMPDYDNFIIYCQAWSKWTWWTEVSLTKDTLYKEFQIEVTNEKPLSQLSLTIQNNNNYAIEINELEAHVIILPYNSELSTKVVSQIVKNNTIIEQPIFAMPILNTIQGENNLQINNCSRVELKIK